MPQRIIDQFTNLPVSATRRCQLRRLARGVCIISGCEKAPKEGGERCKEHSEEHIASVLERYHRNRKPKTPHEETRQ